MPTTLTTLFFLTIFISPKITTENIDQFNSQTNEEFDQGFHYSISRIDSAISLSQEIGYVYGEAYALYQKGYLMNESNENGKALIANLTALRLLERIDSDNAIDTKIRLHINIGLILHKHFKYDEAIQYYKEGLDIARENKLDNWVAELYYKIGYTYVKQGNLNESISWFKLCYENSIDFEDDYLSVNSLNMLGSAFLSNGNYDVARSYFQEVLDHSYRIISRDKYHGKALHNIAETYAAQGEYELSENYYLKALAVKEKRNKANELFITKFYLSKLYLNNGDLDKAKNLAYACESLYPELKKIPANYELFSLLRKIDYQNGNYAQAEKYAIAYETENQTFLDRQSELIQIRDQFKMDILTTSYFSELQRERQIAQLWDAIYYMLLFIFIGFTIWKIRQLYMKRVLERELRTAIQEFNLDDL